MKIYQNEINDGLSEIIHANSKSSLLLDILNVKETHDSYASPLNDELMRTGLFTFSSILVSTGGNLNDDYFEPVETWLAKDSPVHKQINIDHDQKKIVGHVISCYPVKQNEKREIIFDVEDNFDLLTEAVIWEEWPYNEDIEEIIDDLISDIKSGKKKVSMEALFPDFDYAIKSESGIKVVKRDEATSSMSKYLRVYGGDGVYQGSKIYRLLKGIVFNGFGIVDNPANPRSVITKANEENIVTAEEVEQKLAEQKQGFEKQLAEATEKIAELSAQLEVAANEKETIATEASSSKETIEALTKELESAKSTIKTLEMEKVLASRIEKLQEKGFDKEKGREFASKFNSISDEQFEAIVSLINISVAETQEEEIVVETVEENTSACVNTDSKEDKLKEVIESARANYIQKGNK